MKFLFPISIIVAAAILFFMVVNPSYDEVSKLRQDVSVYNTALSNSKDLLTTLDSLLVSYKDIKQEDKDRLEHFLPNTVNNIKFILEIEKSANLHSMPIKNIKFDTQAAQDTSSSSKTLVINNINDTKPYGTFSIEFTTERDYNTFVLFLKDIESNLRLVDVKSISFSVPPSANNKVGQPDSNIFTYNFKVDTYWLK